MCGVVFYEEAAGVVLGCISEEHVSDGGRDAVLTGEGVALDHMASLGSRMLGVAVWGALGGLDMCVWECLGEVGQEVGWVCGDVAYCCDVEYDAIGIVLGDGR